MNHLNDTENKINEEIIRRAIKRSGFREQEKEKLLNQQDIMDALEDVTNLPRLELENIAREVRESYTHGSKDFFSIKHQFFLAALMGFILLSIIAFAVWLL